MSAQNPYSSPSAAASSKSELRIRSGPKPGWRYVPATILFLLGSYILFVVGIVGLDALYQISEGYSAKYYYKRILVVLIGTPMGIALYWTAHSFLIAKYRRGSIVAVIVLALPVIAWLIL